ncbi:MAG TPA: Ig-like domain-containing protein [Solirubrobacteraceae bacterium]|nr:Ig-like domain-containing protein [Solirubrobacteraceae bacterium]
MAPPHTEGWVVVGRGPGERHAALLSAALPTLHGASLATLTVDLEARPKLAADQVQRATNKLRAELAGDMPVAYLGAGPGAGVGCRAALAGGLDGVMAVDGRVGIAWWQVRRVGVPSLLVVEETLGNVQWRLLAARALGRRLDRLETTLVGGRDFDGGVLARWYWDNLLSPAPLPSPRPARCARTRARAATIGIAAAVAIAPFAAPVVAPAGAGAAIPNFAAGSKLAAHEIGGDGAAAARSAAGADATTADPKGAAAKRLRASDIDGDSNALATPFATGSAGLIDGSGVKYFINTDITFSTSSSASAAMSEASYTHSVAASTANGGTTQSRLNDAYDGYQSLCVVNNHDVNARCQTDNGNYVMYNRNGSPAADPTCAGRQFLFKTQKINGLNVSRDVFVPSNDSFARWLNVVTNPGTSPATVTVQTGNNLGSDNNTVVTATSAGNTTPTTSDTWVATFQNFNGGVTTSDPRLGHVMRGPGAPVGLAGIDFQSPAAEGGNTPFWGYTLTVPAGGTRIIVNYGVVQPSRPAAAAKSAQLASLSDPNQLNCMTPTQQGEVLNFVVPAMATADSFSVSHDTTLKQAAPGVLANDPGNSVLSAVLASGPSHAASFSLNADGSFSYTPKPSFAGTDSFTYKSKNQSGGLSPATTVTIKVTGAAAVISSANTAPFTVGQAGSFTIRSTGAPVPTITEATPLPSGLQFKDNGDGTATISGTPATGTSGSHPIAITAANGQGTAATQQLTLAIARGAAPTAVKHSYRTRQGKALVVGAPGVLKGSGGESPRHAVLVSPKARGGSVSLRSNGSFTFRPKAGFAGRGSFTYAAVDPDGGESPGSKVTVTVVANKAAQIKQIERSVEQILASYRAIVAHANQILASVTQPEAIREVTKLRNEALALVKQGELLVHRAQSGNGLTQLGQIAAARRNAAHARRLVAQARAIAARARAAG